MSLAWSSSPSFDSLLLQKLCTGKLLTDIDLVVEGETYSGHRAILSATSEYFFNMFTGNLVEASLSSVPLTGVSSSIFKILFDFIYGESEASIVEKLRTEVCSIEDLLHAADMFQVNSLKNIITTYLISNLDEENMLAVYLLGWKYNIRKVCMKASKKISTKFAKFVKSEEFKLMTIDQLKALFSSPHLQSNETNNCKAVLKWFEFDTENREKDFDKVMSLFCHHNIDCSWWYKTIVPMYERRNRKRKYDEACLDRPSCPRKCSEPVNTIEELSDLYGDRCIHLSKNTNLMNTFTCSYSLHERRIPNSLMKTKLYEKRKKNSEYDSGIMEITFEDQLRHGDHHIENFYQGTPHDADHLIIIMTANYHFIRQNSSLGVFSLLPNVRLIIDDSRFNKEIPSIPSTIPS